MKQGRSNSQYLYTCLEFMLVQLNSCIEIFNRAPYHDYIYAMQRLRMEYDIFVSAEIIIGK